MTGRKSSIMSGLHRFGRQPIRIVILADHIGVDKEIIPTAHAIDKIELRSITRAKPQRLVSIILPNEIGLIPCNEWFVIYRSWRTVHDEYPAAAAFPTRSLLICVLGISIGHAAHKGPVGSQGLRGMELRV